jgi:hypothetical protein
MAINIEIAIVVALFLIGTLVMAVDTLLDYSYRRLEKFFQRRPALPKRSPPAKCRNLHDL